MRISGQVSAALLMWGKLLNDSSLFFFNQNIFFCLSHFKLESVYPLHGHWHKPNAIVIHVSFLRV